MLPSTVHFILYLFSDGNTYASADKTLFNTHTMNRHNTYMNTFQILNWSSSCRSRSSDLILPRLNVVAHWCKKERKKTGISKTAFRSYSQSFINLHQSTNSPSIFYIRLIQFRVAGGGAYPSCHRERDRLHPEHVTSPSQGHIETNNHACTNYDFHNVFLFFCITEL